MCSRYVASSYSPWLVDFALVFGPVFILFNGVGGPGLSESDKFLGEARVRVRVDVRVVRARVGECGGKAPCTSRRKKGPILEKSRLGAKKTGAGVGGVGGLADEVDDLIDLPGHMRGEQFAALPVECHPFAPMLPSLYY
jgi:hypothetical protein